MESNFTVAYNNKTFGVNKEVFAEMSKRFSLLTKGKPSQFLDMSDVVRESSYIEFLNCCQRRSYSITTDNAHDLHYLAKKWNVELIEEDFFELKRNLRPEDLALSKVITRARTGKDYTKAMTVVAKNFSLYIESRLAFALPSKLLAEVIRNLSFECPQNALFDFLVAQYERDPAFGGLFKYLKSGAFTASEIAWLREHPSVPYTPLSSKHQNSLVSMREEVAQHCQLNALDNDSPVSQLKSMIQELKDGLRKRSEAPEAEIPPELQEQLEAVENEIEALNKRLDDENEDALDLGDKHEDIAFDLNSIRKRLGELVVGE